MPTDEFITRLFYMIDVELGSVKKHSQAKLYPSEVVTLMVLFSIKGGHFREFYRWVLYNHYWLFPKLPERTRLQRLFLTHTSYCHQLLGKLSILSMIDTFGIELIHPRREGRSEQQIGCKGKSNGRWIVGIKVAFLINQQGEITDWCWDGANEHDNTFRDVVLQYEGETITFSDLGFRKQGSPNRNFRYCNQGEWNDRYLIETVLSWMTEKFHAKKMYHRGEEYITARLASLAAAFNILLKMNKYEYSMTWFAI